MVICLERGADLHMAQLMPLTVPCFSEIQTGFTFLVPAYLGSPRQRAVKRVCVCKELISVNIPSVLCSFLRLKRLFCDAVVQKAQAARVGCSSEVSIDERVACPSGSEDRQRRGVQCLQLDWCKCCAFVYNKWSKNFAEGPHCPRACHPRGVWVDSDALLSSWLSVPCGQVCSPVLLWHLLLKQSNAEQPPQLPLPCWGIRNLNRWFLGPPLESTTQTASEPFL